MRLVGRILMFCLFFFLWLEVFFSYAADGADPVVGKVFEGCSGCDSCVGVAFFGVVNPLADGANVLFHFLYVLLFIVYWFLVCVYFLSRGMSSSSPGVALFCICVMVPCGLYPLTGLGSMR